MGFQTIHEIPLGKVQVPEGRKLRGPIEGLAASMKEVGLQNPITVTQAGVLISGYHRLEAARALGWKEIAARIMKLAGIKAELAEIDENLCRNEFSPLERADAVARRKEIYEALHPEAKHGGDRKSESFESSGSALPVDSAVKSFAEDTAEKTGTSARTVRADVQISEKIVPEAKADLPPSTSKRELLNVAKEKPAVQKQVAAKLKSGEAKTVKEAVEQVAPKTKPPVLDELEREIPANLTRAWAEITASVKAIDTYLVGAQSETTKQTNRLMAIGEQIATTDPAGARLVGRYLASLRMKLQNEKAITGLSFSLRDLGPYAVCEKCTGIGCEWCGGCGAHERKQKTAVDHEAKRAAGAK